MQSLLLALFCCWFFSSCCYTLHFCCQVFWLWKLAALGQIESYFKVVNYQATAFREMVSPALFITLVLLSETEDWIRHWVMEEIFRQSVFSFRRRHSVFVSWETSIVTSVWDDSGNHVSCKLFFFNFLMQNLVAS